MIRRLGHIFLILLIGFLSCIDPFYPEIEEQSATELVVQGLITDEAGPYTVKVSQSVPLNQLDDENSTVSGVYMQIEEENGLTETLVETSPGVYQTESMVGKANNRYRLKMIYGGSEYESTWETLLASPALDSLTHKVVKKGTKEIDNDIYAVQYFTGFKGEASGARYYRYTFEESWMIRVTYESYYEYIWIGWNQLKPRDPQVYTCWKYENIHPIQLATTSDLTENTLTDFPSILLTGEDERYTRKHSLLVNQYAIDKVEYDYWSQQKEANEELGTLHDKQPATVRGNISNVSNPDDKLLGYFSASGVSSTRTFVKEIVEVTPREDCGVEPITLLISELGILWEDYLLTYLSNGYMLQMVIWSDGPFPAVLGAIITEPQCSDCRVKGGDLQKPDFWDE